MPLASSRTTVPLPPHTFSRPLPHTSRAPGGQPHKTDRHHPATSVCSHSLLAVVGTASSKETPPPVWLHLIHTLPSQVPLDIALVRPQVRMAGTRRYLTEGPTMDPSRSCMVRRRRRTTPMRAISTELVFQERWRLVRRGEWQSTTESRWSEAESKMKMDMVEKAVSGVFCVAEDNYAHNGLLKLCYSSVSTVFDALLGILAEPLGPQHHSSDSTHDLRPDPHPNLH